MQSWPGGRGRGAEGRVNDAVRAVGRHGFLRATGRAGKKSDGLHRGPTTYGIVEAVGRERDVASHQPRRTVLQKQFEAGAGLEARWQGARGGRGRGAAVTGSLVNVFGSESGSLPSEAQGEGFEKAGRCC